MASSEDRPEPLRLGTKAPNFKADTTNGPIDFHDFIGDQWVVLFSHPEDYTPVCTTELGAFAKLEPEFTKRGVKLIGLSANTVDSHGGWIKDINEISGSNLKFPIIGDKERKVAYLYDMLDHQDTTNVDQKGIAFTIRSVFIIDPKKTIRLILSYPASTGRNTAEVLRVVDSLQTGDKHRVTTPINWVPGDDVIVHPSVKNDEAKELFPDFKIIKPYLRTTPLPKEKTSAAVGFTPRERDDEASINRESERFQHFICSTSMCDYLSIQIFAGLKNSANPRGYRRQSGRCAGVDRRLHFLGGTCISRATLGRLVYGRQSPWIPVERPPETSHREPIKESVELPQYRQCTTDLTELTEIGPQRSNWPDASSIPRDPEPPASPNWKLGLRSRLFPKKAPSLEKEQEATFLRSHRSAEDPFPAEVTLGNGSQRQRPRHVPIIISQSIIQSVLRELPDSPVSPASSEQAHFISTLGSTKGLAGCSLDSIYRPRHIPIVIPSFAQPLSLPPPSPPGRYHHTPELSPTSPYSCKRLYFAMSRPTTSGSRTNTLDSTVSAPSPTQTYGRPFKPPSGPYSTGQNGSQTSLNQSVHDGREKTDSGAKSARIGEQRPQSATTSPAAGQQSQTVNGTTHLSGLVCNVHRCTGKQPHALVGATTTILGDKLYVFGGRVLSRRRPPLTSDLYELDLIRRHWTRLETYGDIPPPRYFHSVCALGDTKLICYGGMSPASSPVNLVQNGAQHQKAAADSQPDVVVLSDIHIYDAPTRTWTYIPTANSPQGRYAHCAGVLPSAAIFTSAHAPLSAIHHNPSSEHPNQGTLGVDLDGSGGAEMIVVGGQDSRNQYIEQISVFNLRSLKWTATDTLGRSCGAYRSVVVPLTGMSASRVGKGPKPDNNAEEASRGFDRNHSGSSMLIYSNYNFLDVKLELQIRLPDGSIVEKQMNGQFNPPGLRFPNGGVIDGHFVVSGTFLTSSKQEYALWALDLKSLIWSRIDAGGNVFSQGSWNRGVLWSRRNVFVILGNRKRSLVEDYNHRRVNFSNLCMVELEAFGLYDNPRRMWPTSAYPSVSAPVHSAHSSRAARSGGRPYSKAAIELGQMASGLRELSDMELIAMGGERVPVNSHLLARRWGAYFVRLLRESASSTTSNAHYQNDSASSKSEACTLRPPPSNPPAMTSRNSSITITPSGATIGSASSSNLSAGSNGTKPSIISLDPPTVSTLSPSSRPRALYLPHTILTLRALVHYLYTSSLPPPTHHLCTPQILCSLLQIARPYRVDGLLEAVVERLHQVLDGRNAAAVFNAAAMAAGGGRGTGTIFGFEGELRFDEEQEDEGDENGVSDPSTLFNSQGARGGRGMENGSRDESESELDDDGRSEMSGSTMSSSVAGSDYLSTDGRGVVNGEEIWAGGVSCVVGLQKRGLRGLMEGRRMRERGKGGGSGGGNGGIGVGGGGGAGTAVGLGIA